MAVVQVVFRDLYIWELVHGVAQVRGGSEKGMSEQVLEEE